MITIINKQRSIPIDKKMITATVQRILSFLQYDSFDLGIMFVNNKTMQQYNNQYRGKDKPTDILSFPFYPELKAGERIMAKTDEEKNLGDLIIAPIYVVADAERYEQTYNERMRVLLVHGICHLLGHDHETDEEYETMHVQEEQILDYLKQEAI